MNHEPEVQAQRSAGPTHWQQLVEVSVFLLLILPSMALSFLVDVEEVGFTVLAVSNIMRDLALLGLVLYFVWRNGESFARLGWRWTGVGREALVGLWLFVPFYLAAALLAVLLQAVGLPSPEEPPANMIPAGGGEYLLAMVFLAVVAVSEETLFRGYLLLRFGNLFGSKAGAVVLSAAIFSIGHGYQGTTGVVVVGALGVIFALVYLWRGSLIAPITLHFLQNFMGVIVVPLLR